MNKKAQSKTILHHFCCFLLQFKSSAIDQQTHIVTAQQQANQQQQQQQQHIITKHLNNASAIVQKVIPRNILVSTGRMQNKMEVSVSNGCGRIFIQIY